MSPKDGNWEGRILGSGWSMQSYSHSLSRLWKGNPRQLWVHQRRNLNFCILGTPMQETPHGWSALIPHSVPCIWGSHTHSQSKSHLGTDLTTSPRRTRRLFRTHLLILILSSAVVSSERTMQTVSLRLLPFRRTVSPRNNCSSSILPCGWTWVESQVNKVLDLIF